MRTLPLLPALILATLLGSCTTSTSPGTGSHPAAPPLATFLLGTYDEDSVHTPGIYRYTLLPDGSLRSQGRVAEAHNPSFLTYTADRQQVLAVEELGAGAGSVLAFDVRDGALTNPQQQTVQGGAPCHVAVNPAGYVTVATYVGGTLELFRLTDGKLSPRLDLQDHQQPETEAHAHSSYFTNSGHTVLAADLGTDEVWHYTLTDAQLQPAAPATVRLAEGAGPRHLALHPNQRWAYVINELNSTITQLDLTNDLAIVATWSTLPEDYEGENYCADIHISQDGRFLYGSNRGHNSIVAYRIEDPSGALTLLEHEAVAGDWPRNFALSPTEEYLLIANQRSKNVTTLSRNKDTGMLDFVTSTTTPIPVCILF